jgi:hypothetical protein
VTEKKDNRLGAERKENYTSPISPNFAVSVSNFRVRFPDDASPPKTAPGAFRLEFRGEVIIEGRAHP